MNEKDILAMLNSITSVYAQSLKSAQDERDKYSRWWLEANNEVKGLKAKVETLEEDIKKIGENQGAIK